MKAKNTDFAKLNEAVEQFGSLQKANAQLEADNLNLEKKTNQLEQELNKLTAIRYELNKQIQEKKCKIEDYQSQLQSVQEQLKNHRYQYELFCGFMAMLTESPSVTYSIDLLIAIFQKLKEPGWYLTKKADEMRTLFVHIVTGDFLKCFRCSACGAKFMVNQKPVYKTLGNQYYCPSCYNSSLVADDSFLRAMVTEEQVDTAS